jgi:hypothetical protein
MAPGIKGWAVVCAVAVASAPAAAQTRVAAETTQKRLSAQRTRVAPVIDGNLDEAAWSTAVPVSDFVQSEPTEGQPASEKTEVRLLYDDKMIYVGVICYDADPSRIVTTDSRRDSGLDAMDSFRMIFDTYHDRQNGFIFGTNVTGIEYDAQVRNEGESLRTGPPGALGGGNAGGSGAGVNVNWDGSWEVKTQVTAIGWIAEFAIPLRTLRYGPPPQVWGVNFSRNIQHKREQVYWSPISRIYTLSRLSSAGELRDMSVPAPRDLKLMPYTSGSFDRNFAAGADTVRDGQWGIDAKIGVTSSTTLDLTYNTDFAQVEVDEQQINLTRFNLLFPEKRPFFLENRGLFAVGKSGEVDLFFSRRIGIADNGSFVPIQAGARLTGKANGLNVGLLNMQTERVDGIPANNFSAVRVSRDLRNRSSVGAIFVNRSATGDNAGVDNWNRSYGVDGRLGIGEGLTFSGFAARTQTPGLDGRQHAYSSAVEYRERAFNTSVSYTEVGEDFNPEVGFLERPDGYRQATAGYHQNVRTSGLTSRGIREWRPHVSYEGFWGFDGFLETATLHIDNAWDFENGYTISPALNVQYEGLREPFEVYPGVVVPAGSYRSPMAFGVANTDRRKWISASLNWQVGGFLSGDQASFAPTLTLRHGGRFTSALRWTRNDIDLPQGSFVTNLGSVRLTYNITTLINAQTLIQYNDRTRRWSTNLRFNWQRTAATGLYVVYNDTEAFNGLGPVSRAFIVKYSHMFDILQ